MPTRHIDDGLIKRGQCEMVAETLGCAPFFPEIWGSLLLQ
jgi:hypothetical protein